MSKEGTKTEKRKKSLSEDYKESRTEKKNFLKIHYFHLLTALGLLTNDSGSYIIDHILGYNV